MSSPGGSEFAATRSGARFASARWTFAGALDLEGKEFLSWEVEMDVATISANGQIALPVDVRRRLGLGPGDKVIFVEYERGDTLVVRPSAAALIEAQRAFARVAKQAGFSSPEDVDAYAAGVRAERRRRSA
ncbi:MAG: AbrB/MazE/SpoVT family DNA-binding domain-containing protein [Actinomycetia bacterium]|nr:AbrB/MazE/SpoVT family DNA-binding domain-containing protein [Actinomycetes bacterium]